MAAAAAIIGCTFVSPASATVIGPLDIANCGGGGVTFTATTIVFSPPSLGGTAGCMQTEPGTNLTYSNGTLVSGVSGDVLNLNLGGGTVDDFMTFSATTLDFVLTGLGPGDSNTNCTGLSIGASCSMSAGNPFVLTNLGGGNTRIDLPANGTITDGGSTSPWSGEFTMQVNIAADTIQSVILASGSVGTTYTGHFNVVPEPSTFSMLAFAGLIISGVKRRRS
jgi:hypothetical protein